MAVGGQGDDDSSVTAGRWHARVRVISLIVRIIVITTIIILDLSSRLEEVISPGRLAGQPLVKKRRQQQRVRVLGGLVYQHELVHSEPLYSCVGEREE